MIDEEKIKYSCLLTIEMMTISEIKLRKKEHITYGVNIEIVEQL